MQKHILLYKNQILQIGIQEVVLYGDAYLST